MKVKKQAKIFYFSLDDEETKEEKLEWFKQTSLNQILFERITPDKRYNWVNLTDNDFDDFLFLIDKQVKAGRSEEAVFRLFSRGVATQRDEWVYDFSLDRLREKIEYMVKAYQNRLKTGKRAKPDIKWDRETEKYLARNISKQVESGSFRIGAWRPFIKKNFYFDPHFNGMVYQNFTLFPKADLGNKIICSTDTGTQSPYMLTCSDCVPDLHLVGTAAQCLPLYRYDEKGDRHDNITDWGLNQTQTHYNDPTITKLDIFHYTYAVLHHPAYRTKYEINLKRDFPRLPYYTQFHQWVAWGKTLMDLHINYETVDQYELKILDTSKGKSTRKNKQKQAQETRPKPKLKADKDKGYLILDTHTTLTGVPAIAWDYKLGNRSALEWILNQYKEKKPRDPTIREKFNTYRFADYKDTVIDLLQRVCTVSVETMAIINQMPEEIEKQESSSVQE